MLLKTVLIITNCTQNFKHKYCCVQTFTRLNIVKHVESSFENPYGGESSKQWGTLRNDLDDEVM